MEIPVTEQQNKILIVEDEPSLRTVLADSFRNAGFTVYIAKDGEEGLFIAEEEMPDLILLDMIMPRMDGMAMAQRLRENKKLSHIPIIFLSNLGDGELSSGKWDESWEHLVKSDWKMGELIGKVKEKLSTAV